MAFVRQSFEPEPVDMDGTKDVEMQVLIGKEEESPTCIMRRFKVASGGHSPHHSHDYEHVVFVVSGEGTLLASAEEHRLENGTSLLVKPNEIHQFRADKGGELQFLCIIPIM